MTNQQSPTIAEAIENFYAYKFGSLRKNSQLVTQASIEAIEKCCDLDFKTSPVTALNKHVLRAAYAAYGSGEDRNPKKERAKSTVHRRHQDWREFFDFLVIDGYTEGSPMAAVRIAKPDKRGALALDRWEEDSIPRLLKSSENGDRKGRSPWPERDVAVVAVLLATGVRASEFCDMTIGSVQGKHPEYYVRVVGKGDKARTIPIEPEIDQTLGTYLESRKERFPKWKQKRSDPLWLGDKNEDGTKAMTRWQLDYILERSLAVAGIERQKGAMAHAFRHTYGSILAASGMSIVGIANLMGHESVVTSQGYISSIARDERAGAAKNSVYEALNKLNTTEE